MLAVHVGLRGGYWAVDLVASAAVGTVAYAVVLLVAGLTPTERAAVARVFGRGPAHP